MLYRVTTGLNLRAEPSATATRIGSMPRNAMVTGAGDSAPAGWAHVVWNGAAGFASMRYLEPAGSAQASAPSLPAIAPPPAPSPDQRDRNTAKLHPAVRTPILATVATLNAEGLPFRIFEGFRTPERQAALYAQGRTKPGDIVTRAQAWRSLHQYGLAADLVLFIDGGWSWGGKRSDWMRMHEVAKTNGLQWLSFEMPHVEIAGADVAACLAGRFPAGGDESWFEAVSGAAARWARAGGAPGGPSLRFADRPPLADQILTD